MSESRITQSDLNLLRAELKLEVVTLHTQLISDLIDTGLWIAAVIVFVILLVA
ncbi:UNVERIFIED_ORG: hypothetical protein J2W65_003828 [Pseudomonas parafulva]|uniref:Uncharacterized protein n=1 Tax=Pseudomonas fulva TaxID=47880 RepID=A0A7S9LEE4_9PSED|nr:MULTISPECIES: hypothetical protein [Pseudomonas]MDP9558174.1 hypothetical protein [Pseudomonas parafulva]MBA1208866.1 hypothetical protein [Pseudomonas fulva]MBA1217956.1 hypothetical protein [Pseudomonas fulva]MBA1222985.1 hypothetical protein [Pseudomonas fulva]MBN4167607.1 hypothetical protein [Pseudomonas fulva]